MSSFGAAAFSSASPLCPKLPKPVRTPDREYLTVALG